MTRIYRHLTFEERCQIKIQKKSGLSKDSIAQHRPSSPFGLHPHCDEGRVSRFTLETGLWFPQLAGCKRLFVFACLRLRDDVVPALADAAHVRGDARTAQRRTKQPFGQIPLDLSTEHG